MEEKEKREKQILKLIDEELKKFHQSLENIPIPTPKPETTISNLNKFLEKESTFFKFKKFITEIEEGKKGLEIRVNFGKQGYISDQKLFQWAKKEFGIDQKQQNDFVNALIKDFLIAKENNDTYKVLEVEERRKLKRRQRLINSHEFSLAW